jgi:hypothetical protein
LCACFWSKVWSQSRSNLQLLLLSLLVFVELLLLLHSDVAAAAVEVDILRMQYFNRARYCNLNFLRNSELFAKGGVLGLTLNDWC